MELVLTGPVAGQLYRLAVQPSSIDRRGCFTLEDIPTGAIICEYTGERIPAAEALRREADPLRPGIYTFWVDDQDIIDGWVGGNESIYINHACAPNCMCRRLDGHVYIAARRPIPAGTELTIDYAYDPATPPERCFCGGPTCRGFLNAPGPI